MQEFKIIKIKEKPEIKEKAAMWFHSKWGVQIEAYLESMDASLKNDPVQEWYLCLKGEEIIGGMGEIYNDFYEKYGWEFLCMVQGDGEPEMARMYIHN